MKNIFFEIGSLSKYIFIAGFLGAIMLVAASAVLYFGAGRWWDYYFCISLSEKLLAASRPTAVSACVCALLAEYKRKTCNKT